MNEVFDKFKDLKVLVIGDIMLDKYYYSNVSRISPEAPVPIAKYEKEKSVLGGAANVALNLSSIGAKTSILGKIGNDENSKIISNLFSQNNINFEKIEINSDSITKIRIVSKSSQLLRLDFEDEDFYYNNGNSELLEKLKSIIGEFDVVIVSDYQKGVVNQELIEYLRHIDKYISIDSKPGSFKNFEGFSLVKPNFVEAVGIAKSLGSVDNFKNTDLDVENLGNFLKEKLNSNILITRSEMGVSYSDGNIYHAPLKISEVIDVTGAGDTCISIFSLLDFLGIDKVQSLEIMNAAAKVSVSKFGTYTPSIEEIKNELYLEEFNNIITFDKVDSLVEKLKANGKKIVFTNGCFDLVHKSHVTYLNDAKSLGDILIVGLNSDSSVSRLKGNTRPVVEEASRAFVLSNFKSVDYVVIFEQYTPIELIRKIKPNIHVKGGDYKSKVDLIETPIVEEFGGEVILIDSDSSYSTSNIIKKIKEE